MERKKIKPMDGYPIGYRFRPSEDDLFFHYLTKKVEGQSEAIPPFMPEVDIYGDEDPWEIFDANAKESFYVFTRLKMIKSRVKRTAGSGTWSNGNKREIVDDRGYTVGYNKLFTFKSSTGSEKTKNGHWTMHEYSMKGQELVVCAITNLEMAEKKGSGVITIGSNEEHRRGKKLKIMEDYISPQHSSIVSEACTSKPPIVNLASCDYPVHVDNAAHHQMLYAPPMPISVVSSTPSNQVRNEPMRQPPNEVICQDYPGTPYVITFEGSTAKVHASPSSSIHAADAQDNNHDGIGDKDDPTMHYEITFEENATEVDVPPSSSIQAADAQDDNINDAGFYGSPLMPAVGASTPAQPWAIGPELALSDLYDELEKLLAY
ncbi:hypothetical protein NL676_002649 [Syzygium grande]|nr:hypothetical protein NL676_002649 [Syzygium grande]